MGNQFTTTKTMVEKYTIRHSTGKYWADIVLDCGVNSGRIQVASDFGDWQYFFGACGAGLKKFLIGLDLDYLAEKTGNDQYFDLKNTLATYRRDIDSDLKAGAIDADLAACLRDQVESLETIPDENENEFFLKFRVDCPDLLAYYNYIPATERIISPQFKAFWTNIWSVFVEHLKAEMKAVNSPFSHGEEKIMQLLCNAHNLFVKLPNPHPMAHQEWCFYFHGLQSLLEHSALKRMYPQYFR